MMKRIIFFCIFLCHPVFAQTVTVILGHTPVKIIRETVRNNGKTLVHLHENETTALAAAKTFTQRHGGTLLTLQHGGTRNIIFDLNQKRYEVDPNRIFTDTGIQRSLTQYGAYSKPAHREVRRLAQAILHLIPPGKVIAVHNNRDYSLKEYFPNHAMEHDAKAVHYQETSNFRNFYFVTNEQDYERLKGLDFNVALQSKNAQDDGSLSYYLSKRDYINIEAAYGELKAQLRMLYHA